MDLELWLAYCYFHLGDYNNAMIIYQNLIKNSVTKHLFVNLACCYFYLGMYPEAEEVMYFITYNYYLKMNLVKIITVAYNH